MHIARDVDRVAGGRLHHLGEMHHAVVLPLAGGVVEGIFDEVLDFALAVAVGADVEVDLERGEPRLEDLVDDLLAFVEVHAGRDFTVGVDANLVAELAAKQLVDRGVQRLAFEIPKRDLDAGQRCDQRAGKAAFEDAGAPQLLEKRIDRERVAADQFRAKLVLDKSDRLVAAMDAFAEPGDVGIGLDLDPQVHAMADRGRGLYRRDLHAVSSRKKAEREEEGRWRSVSVQLALP